MSDKPGEAVIRAWVRLTRAQQRAQRVIEAALKAANLPPLSWYDVLLETERAGKDGLRPVALEHAMLLAQYNLSRLVDRMVAAGLVERQPCEDDGRGHRVAVTDPGRALRRRMWPVYARAIEQAVGRHLTARQAKTLGDLLGSLG
ncbi:MAG: winged helix-turn-helix transcriptional regulator [Alphaproteobacteria bacterium]|nr:winged helix-turn-helix transcriptional regulator [Alphaproteobacteria bacterium]